MRQFFGQRNDTPVELSNDMLQAIEAFGEQHIAALSAQIEQQNEDLQQTLEARLASISDPAVREVVEEFTAKMLAQQQAFSDDITRIATDRIRQITRR